MEWFYNLPIYNKEGIPIAYQEQNFPQCINYPNLKVQSRELHAFEKHLFTSSFSHEVVTCDQNLFTDDFWFNSFFIKDNIGKTNKKIDPY